MIFLNPEIKTNKNLPNMALAYAATILNTKVIDLNTKPKPRKRFLEREIDVLGISIQSRAYEEAEKIKKEYLQKYKNSKVKSVQTPIDIQCCYPFVDFSSNGNQGNKKIIVEAEFSDSLPFPNYQLFDSFKIFQKNWQKGKWAYPIMTSLGCPYQCTYCMARNRHFKARSAENCFRELKEAKEKWNIKSFQIVDDCFSFNKARALEFCQLIKPLNLNWFCTNGLRVDLFNEEIAKIMADSGCQEMSFGVETINPELLIKIKKGETVEQIERAIKIAKKYFKVINLYFIIGLPESSFKKDLESFHWVLQNKVKAHFSYFLLFNNNLGRGSSFYGQGARPMSEAYDEKLQKRIYNMSGYMRGDVKKLEIFKNVLKAFVFILIFDTKNIFSHFNNLFSIFFNKTKSQKLL